MDASRLNHVLQAIYLYIYTQINTPRNRLGIARCPLILSVELLARVKHLRAIEQLAPATVRLSVNACIKERKARREEGGQHHPSHQSHKPDRLRR